MSCSYLWLPFLVSLLLIVGAGVLFIKIGLMPSLKKINEGNYKKSQMRYWSWLLFLGSIFTVLTIASIPPISDDGKTDRHSFAYRWCINQE